MLAYFLIQVSLFFSVKTINPPGLPGWLYEQNVQLGKNLGPALNMKSYLGTSFTTRRTTSMDNDLLACGYSLGGFLNARHTSLRVIKLEFNINKIGCWHSRFIEKIYVAEWIRLRAMLQVPLQANGKSSFGHRG